MLKYMEEVKKKDIELSQKAKEQAALDRERRVREEEEQKKLKQE